MGAPSKELWAMLILCIPIIVWQAWIFAQANATVGYLETAFEVVFVACGSYLVWRYGGLVEAVTKVLEFTRVWDQPDPRNAAISSATATLNLAGSESFPSGGFCTRCGYRLSPKAKFCRRCGTQQDRDAR